MVKKAHLIDVLVNGNADSADKQIMFNDSLKTEIERSLSILTERQKEVICYFFGIGVDHHLALKISE